MRKVIAVALMLAVPLSVWGVPKLSTPWPCDVSYRITQGHNGGSHTGNGAWAWDIGIPVGADVTAPADGTIRRIRMDSTTGGCSSSYGNDANYVVVDFGDGTEALLLHLQANSSTLRVGDRVKRGQVVGKVGLTGWVCGAHLHFQIQRTCDSWWCPSIQANFEDYGDPTTGTFASNNCPECETVITLADTTTIDERDPSCFTRETNFWWSVAEGQDDHHYYTFGTDAAQPETSGKWNFDVGEAGRYAVEAFIPNTEADSQGARYTIFDGQTQHTSNVINQSAQKGWVTLGTFDFTPGTDRFVMLGDNTGESYDLRRKLAYDAVRIAPKPPENPEEPVDPTDPQDPIIPGETNNSQEPDLNNQTPSNNENPNDPNVEADPNQVDESDSVNVTTSACNSVGGIAAPLALGFAFLFRRRRKIFGKV